MKIKKTVVEEVIGDPDYLSEDKEQEVIEVIKEIDAKHILRVIYKTVNGIIVVITFHPAEKGRYEKK